MAALTTWSEDTSAEDSAQQAVSSALLKPTEVRAFHRDGQTFLTWNESPEFAYPSPPSAEAVRLRRHDLAQRIQYRIYRASQPIASVRGLTPVGVGLPLSGWNADFYGTSPRPEHLALRYRISDEGEPLPPSKALYVHNPGRAESAYYVVTVVVNGIEDTSITNENRTSEGVVETVGVGTPVLQRREQPDLFVYVERPQLYFYTRWEAPPRANRESQPFDYLVAIPQGVKNPAPVGIHLHGWGASLTNDFGWWYNATEGAVLVSTNQIPYDWWTGYHELLSTRPLKTAADWQSGVVRPFTQTRLLAFVDWLATTRPIDLTRTFASGVSMGGSGSLMLAIRYPDRIAWAGSWVGIHRPHMSPTFAASYADVYGPANYGVKYQDGTPVWEYFDDVLYIRRNRATSLGFLAFSNGKNDLGIGWQQAVDFYRALQEARQPHLFIWGQEGHGQRAPAPGGAERTMMLDLRTNRSLPAFTRGSLDEDPGDGTVNSGSPSGQSNLYLTWEQGTIQDAVDRWEVTVAVLKAAPVSSARVDITPRRCQNFKPAPGETVAWSNSNGSRTLQSGQVIVDSDGLVTLPEVLVSTAGSRIRLTRQSR